MEIVRDDWNALDNKKEIRIIDKYTNAVHVCTMILTLFTCFSLVIFLFMEITPIILDTVAPLNESRPRNLHTITEYFVDREKYFLFLLLHELLATYGGAFTILATGTITIAFIHHVCGMLKVVSFRIECILEKSVLEHPIPRTERMICDRIISAVDLHRRTLKLFDMIMSTFTLSYSILIIIGVTSISLNLYRLLQPTALRDTADLMTNVVLLIAHFIYMFVANYIGQGITDHCDDIFNATCSILWYIAPLQSQKLLLFLMHRTIKTLKPVVGKIFVASLEGFATLSTTSLSYLTVIYSLQ